VTEQIEPSARPSPYCCDLSCASIAGRHIASMSAAILSSRGTRGAFASSASLKAILSQLRQSSTSSGRRDWRISLRLGAAARPSAGTAQRFMSIAENYRDKHATCRVLGIAVAAALAI
jgi:hypothetical protein